MFLKKVKVPISNEIKEINTVQLWEVRWTSRYGDFSSQTRPEIEVFTNELDAREFEIALNNAFVLIRHTSGNNVSVTKGK